MFHASTWKQIILKEIVFSFASIKIQHGKSTKKCSKNGLFGDFENSCSIYIYFSLIFLAQMKKVKRGT